MILIIIGSVQACTQNTKMGSSVNTSRTFNEETGQVEEDISDFLIKAASVGMMEVQLGSTAEQNSKSLGVKKFGTMMVKDHSQANLELKALAAARNISLPVAVYEIHQKRINELTPLRGSEFDVKYMKMMVDDHQDDIALFERAAKFADAEVGAFATKTLPILKKHQEAAKKISDGLKE